MTCRARPQWVQILDILQEAGLGDDFALRMCEELLLPAGSPGGGADDRDQDKKARGAESDNLGFVQSKRRDRRGLPR